MFPRPKRLTRKSFPAPSLRATRASSAHFTAVAPEERRGYAVVISKKTIRLSTKRHNLKRRVLGALCALDLPLALVVYARKGAQDLAPQELRKELTELLSKVKTSRTM